jgi:DNA-binding NarL/FixJ family response regulator
MKICRVLIADDQPIFAEGLRSILTAHDRLFLCRVQVIRREENQVQDSLRQFGSDLLLLDLRNTDREGLQIVSMVKNNNVTVRVLVMTTEDDPGLVKAAFRAGADGYMMKDASQDELLRAIEQLLIGKTYLGLQSNSHDRPSESKNDQQPENRFARRFGLTRREVEIMGLIGQAMNNRDISAKLFISEQTAGVHRKNIMRKLGVNSTANLIKLAFENGLV